MTAATTLYRTATRNIARVLTSARSWTCCALLLVACSDATAPGAGAAGSPHTTPTGGAASGELGGAPSGGLGAAHSGGGGTANGGTTPATGGASAGSPSSGGHAALGGAGGTATHPAGGGGLTNTGGSGMGGAGRHAAGAAGTSTAIAGSTGQGGSRATGGAGNQAGNGGSPAGAGAGGADGGTRPCDLFASANTPCVAAHSSVRALYAAYGEKLYQVRRADNTTQDIPALTPGGAADSAQQDAFCSGTTCVLTILYDQSGHGNDLVYQGPGGSEGHDTPARATTEKLSVLGHSVYSLYIAPGNSYWRDGSMTAIPKGKEPEGMYMVTSGTHFNDGCCFDYGNSETTRKADGAGAMDAINFGNQCWFGGCTGTGPWVQADLEYGLFPGGSKSWNASQKAFPQRYVTALLKNNGTTEFALKGADATSGSLTTLYQGSLPSGYNPMKKQGAIVLGSGGDCCATNTNLSEGTFYEGAVVSGYPTDATDDAVQRSIVAAGYAK